MTTETTTAAPGWPRVKASRIEYLLKQGLRRICNRYAHDTLCTGIDLDRHVYEACVKLEQQQPLESVLLGVGADHPAAPEAVVELRRLYASVWLEGKAGV